MLSRETKIYCMLVITGGFFLVEIIIGYYVHSLALVADSFHMMNDMLSMGVALWAIKVASKTQWDPKYSYGWQRAEILGALINGVFLLALCFTIFLESIERFANPEPITNPVMVLITGGAGLFANLLGLLLFHEHGHGHGHSHGHEHNHDAESPNHGHDHGHLNMRGIFLHVLGDALGNVGVIVSALFIWLTPFSWRFYFDPIVSILITIIIFMSAVPLVRQTSKILLQCVPKSVPLDVIHAELVKMEGLISVHELHVWQLSDTKIIASLHVLLKSRQTYMTLGSDIRKVFHKYGIHSATIQPEFIDDKLDSKVSLGEVENSDSIMNIDDFSSSSTCLLRCAEDSCLENTCCPPENNNVEKQ